MHQTENMYVPSLIFGHLLTSSNYDDTQKKVTGRLTLMESLVYNNHCFVIVWCAKCSLRVWRIPHCDFIFRRTKWLWCKIV